MFGGHHGSNGRSSSRANTRSASSVQGRHPTVAATPEVILEENSLLLGELEGSLNALTLIGSGMAGSVGVALAGTRISGLMPFGPAYQSGRLDVGDDVVSIDGVDVSPGTVVNAMTGELESDIQIQVRKKHGEIRIVDLVRTSSAKLLIAHNLAQHLHTLYKNFDTSTTPTGETDVIRLPDIELQRIVGSCIGLLQDLQDQVILVLQRRCLGNCVGLTDTTITLGQVSRTEGSTRGRLRQAQQKMCLLCRHRTKLRCIRYALYRRNLLSFADVTLPDSGSFTSSSYRKGNKDYEKPWPAQEQQPRL
jgi:hypothetical protein